MLTSRAIRVFVNPRHGVPGLVVLSAAGFRRAKAEITGWDGYAVTPLRNLPRWAESAGIAAIRLKDEASRFGLGSFKALGGAYAVANLLRDTVARSGAAPETVTVTCATDGNHGRSVAWGANRFHCRCVIFVHENVSQWRIDAIAAYGAEVRRVAGTYDNAVRVAARTAETEGWLVASDTSWPGYTEVPRGIMQGYRIMADEAADQWDGPAPTHVFIQGGVGGAAAAVSVHLRARFDPAPNLIVVEPDRAACLFASAETGALTAIPGDLDTVMAGLACGEPSLLAWEELSRSVTAFMSIPDESATETVHMLKKENIGAGESGVAGLAGCMLAAKDEKLRGVLELSHDSRILAFNTEGPTAG
jgi:diaminopropionate ammonia-lyase